MAGSANEGLRHVALFYRGTDDYALAIAGFLRGCSAVGEPALVAVPGIKHDRLRQAVDQRPVFVDMSELGRNPARIIPAIQTFIDGAAGERIWFVGEPIWPGRSAPEIREATRHEMLINLAFASSGATVLCPYDAAGLPDDVIADARQTHPVLLDGGRCARSQTFGWPDRLPARCAEQLPGVPADARVEVYAQDLRSLRTLITDEARHAGLSHPRVVDLVLAVSEVAANTLRHTSSGGTMSLWRAGGELICQLADTGHIADPLAGRRPPDRDHPGGQGLWLVNQICDLVEIRTGRSGTVVRLHMLLPAPGAP